VVGLGLVAASAIAAGDWWLARQPWIGIGLAVLAIGLGASAVSGLWLDLVEPIGWWRLVTVPAAVVVGFWWWVWLVPGLGTTGLGGPVRDVPVILYSVPDQLDLVLVGTVLMMLPLGVRAFRMKRPQVI
jgi:hypothetical protein